MITSVINYIFETLKKRESKYFYTYILITLSMLSCIEYSFLAPVYRLLRSTKIASVISSNREMFLYFLTIYLFFQLVTFVIDLAAYVLSRNPKDMYSPVIFAIVDQAFIKLLFFSLYLFLMYVLIFNIFIEKWFIKTILFFCKQPFRIAGFVLFGDLLFLIAVFIQWIRSEEPFN